MDELLDFRLMNKAWNNEARRVLRNQRKCEVSLEGKGSCTQANLLNDLMERMDVVFFNGLSVEVCRRRKHCNGKLLEGRNIEEVYGNILKMPLKHVEVT